MVPLSALVPTIGTRKPEAQEIATDSQKNHAKVEKRIWKKVKERKKTSSPYRGYAALRALGALCPVGHRMFT